MDFPEIPVRRLSRASIAAIGAILAAALLRSRPLLDNRFHPDEALYAYFARLIASGQDPMLAGALVDKPPFSFYLTALSMWLIGPTELAARLPELFASIISVALVYALGRRLYGAGVGVASAILLALSPFAILFAVTVFVDPLLTASVLGAAWAAAAGRWRAMGFALALAFATKQTALVFVPLILALSSLAPPSPATLRALAGRLFTAARPMLIVLAATTALIFGWDVLRHPAIGFWSQGYSDNLPNRLVRASEVLPRALAWINLQHYFTGSSVVNGVLAAGLPILLLAGARRRTRAAVADFVLAGYLLVYLAAYWLLAFNVWDRYLLPVLPLWLMLLARAAQNLAELLRWALGRLQFRLPPRATRGWVTAALALLILPGSAQATRSAFPIGGDHGAYDGIDRAAGYLHGLPPGTVLYDHWLSWEWSYYLFDAPVYVSWFPSPQALTVDLKAFGMSSPRYLAVPAWESIGEVRAAAAAAGYEMVAVFTAHRRDGLPTLTVYSLRWVCSGGSDGIQAN